MKPWRTLERRTLLECGRFLTVEEHDIELPDGRRIQHWPWLITPEYATVAAITESGQYLCLRQTKYAVSGISLAVVGGYLEAGEDALTCARRELLEEAGYEAATWTCLGHYPVDGNRGAGMAHPFLARGARRIADVHADDLEEQEIVLLPPADVEAALRAGEFKLMSWALTIALALASSRE